MTKEFKGLENKLEGVSIGDLLLLLQEGGDMAVGFVEQLTPKRVKLSHESPENSNVHAGRYFPTITKENGEYRLRDYNKYMILDLNLTSK